MEIKTCEQYVLAKLTSAENTIADLESENEVLTATLKAYEAGTILTYKEKLGEYYFFNSTSVYNYNDILRGKNKTPEFLRECLEDVNKLTEFMNMKYSWYEVGRVCKSYYQAVLMKGDHMGLITFSDVASSVSTEYFEVKNVGEEEGYFLSYDECHTACLNKIRENIESYFDNKRDEKFGNE